MSEFEKAQILHDLKGNFSVPDDLLDTLLAQINDSEIKKNFDRITKGLSIEDNYKMIFSALPWVKNINGLHQQQEKRHKEQFQVPDYALLVEDSQKNVFPIFVDVKSVTGDKKTCRLIPKQINNIKNYSLAHKTILLIAIYWQKYGYWTHNCLSHFSGKKKNKISIEDALKNDLSHVLSDYTFIIDKPFFRKTLFGDKNRSSAAIHEEYGTIERVFIGKSKADLEEYSLLESAIVDSIFSLTPIEYIEEGSTRYQVEKIEKYPMLVKVSNWLVNFLNTTNLDYATRIDGMLITEYARIGIVNLMHKLGYSVTYQIPDKKNKCTDRLFSQAYHNTWLEKRYRDA